MWMDLRGMDRNRQVAAVSNEGKEKNACRKRDGMRLATTAVLGVAGLFAFDVLAGDAAPRSRGFLAQEAGFATAPGLTETAAERLSGIERQNLTDTLRGDQVDIASGNKLDSQLDFSTGGELPLYLQRTYNLNWSGNGLFGFHWVSNFDYQLKFGAAQDYQCYASPGAKPCADTSTYTEVWLFRPDGRKIQLKKSADGVFYQNIGLRFENKPGGYLRMTRQGDGSWLVNGEQGQTELYSSAGFPLRLTNEAGLSWTYTYGGINGSQLQTVTHTSGRAVTFIWDGAYLKEVRDPAGNRYQYGYAALSGLTPNAKAGLVSVTYPDGMQIGYQYAGASQPWGLARKLYNGILYSSFSYDAKGNTQRSERSGGTDKYSFVYKDNSDGTVTVTETNPLGKISIYVFKSSRLLNVTRMASASTSAEYKEITYDGNGYLDKVADFNGNFTDYDFNARGQLLRVVEGAGSAVAKTTTYTWQDPQNRLTSITVEGVLRTEYGYTNGGRLALVKETNLSPKGVTNQTRTTTYNYSFHSNGMPATVTMDGPLAQDKVIWSYDGSGNLTSMRNELGHTTTYANYNGLGQPGKVTGPNGEVIETSYDARGRVTSQRQSVNNSGNWATTAITYNGVGDIASITEPSGLNRRYYYDAARRLTEELEPETGDTFAHRRYIRDAMSNVIKVEISRTDYPPGTVVTGNIDEVTHDANWNWFVRGWACSTGMNRSIDVHAYAGSTFLVAGTANVASEPEVAAVCQASGAAYRFQLPLTLAQRQQLGGQAITIYGISPVGENRALNGSGLYAVPKAEIIGDTAGITQDANWNYAVEGWACSVGANTPTQVHVYVGGPAGSGT